MIEPMWYIIVSKDGYRVIRNATKGTGQRSWNLVFGSRRDVAQPMTRIRATSVLRSAGSAYTVEPVRP